MIDKNFIFNQDTLEETRNKLKKWENFIIKDPVLENQNLLSEAWTPDSNLKTFRYINVYKLVARNDIYQQNTEDIKKNLKNLIKFENLKNTSDESKKYWEDFSNKFNYLINGGQEELTLYSLPLINWTIMAILQANEQKIANKFKSDEYNKYLDIKNKIDYFEDTESIDTFYQDFSGSKEKIEDSLENDLENLNKLNIYSVLSVINKTQPERFYFESNLNLLDIAKKAKNFKTNNEFTKENIDLFIKLSELVFFNEFTKQCYDEYILVINEYNAPIKRYEESTKNAKTNFIKGFVSGGILLFLLVLLPLLSKMLINKFVDYTDFPIAYWVSLGLALAILLIMSIVLGVYGTRVWYESRKLEFFKSEDDPSTMKMDSKREAITKSKDKKFIYYVLTNKKPNLLFKYASIILMVLGFLGTLFNITKLFENFSKTFEPLYLEITNYKVKSIIDVDQDLDSGNTTLTLYQPLIDTQKTSDEMREKFTVNREGLKTGKYTKKSSILDTKNSKILYLCNFKNGVKNGDEISYEKDQFEKWVYFVRCYEMGILNGNAYIFDGDSFTENKNLQLSTAYSNGKENGNRIEWYYNEAEKTLQYKEITQFENGLKHGFHLLFFLNQTVSTKEAYWEGNKISVEQYEKRTNKFADDIIRDTDLFSKNVRTASFSKDNIKEN
ncbi:hypothetical protein [Mycoplasma buteonis]|uniref:hypothetical protein n=1 Tax=Mycoplasma buteonis TaxID=171280 RepID=UPI00055BA4F8|nr:hypothetical protein [Mycoplasma buteonis]